MLFLAKQGSVIDVAFEIGNFGVGAFKFAAYENGKFLMIGEQVQKPFVDTAQFNVSMSQLQGLGWGTQGFALRVLGMSDKSSAKLPLSITVVQNDVLLPALDPSNNTMNGKRPPFTAALATLLTPGEPIDYSFGVYFK
jgi:hypothetical protein